LSSLFPFFGGTILGGYTLFLGNPREKSCRNLWPFQSSLINL
jgi:hypothetical protein